MIYQAQAKGCGYAAVKMALVHASGRRDFAYADEPDAEEAPSLNALIDYAGKHGLVLRPYRLEKPRELRKNRDYPVLAVCEEDGRSHMVYVQGYRHKKFIVFDPASGVQKLGSNEFFARFSGVYLALGEYEEKGEAFKKKRPISLADTAHSISLSIVPVVLIGASILLLGTELPKYLSVIAFVFGLLSLIASYAFTRRVSRRFVRDHSAPLLCENDNLRQERFKRFEAYFRTAFSGKNQAVVAFFSALGIGVVLAFRDAFLGYAIAVSMAVYGLLAVFDGPLLSREAKELGRMESFFLRGDAEHRRASYFALRKQAERYGDHLFVRELVFFAVASAISFVFLAPQGRLSFDAFVYYFFGIVYFLMKMDEGRRALELEEERRKEEPYFVRTFL
ncbi:MAG: hypothetical protein HUJ60_02230 [Bacilli bacterium]|nr:hypothetical protein [Bacilli bacterium]